MQETIGRDLQEDAFGLIEIRLSRLQQLFNSFDPSPFHEKDLDQDAEAYITGSADEFPLPLPLKLIIHLPAEQLPLAEGGNLSRAIHNYFGYRRHEAQRRLRFRFREGRIALLIGLVFLFACMSIRQLAFALGSGPVPQIVAEGMLILGWVAMWRPLELLLYDWWPVRHSSRLYAKLAEIPVEVRLASGGS